MSQAWLMISGKGGVGKSTVASSLGVELAMRGKTCCCVDTDIGLRCLDLLFGLQDELVYDVIDVAEKNSKLKYSVIRHHEFGSLTLLPASQLRKADALDTDALEHIVRKLKKRCEYVLLDAPAGIGKAIDPMLKVADRVILVTTPDDVAIRDAEQAVTLIRKKKGAAPLLIVNRVNRRLLAEGVQYAPQTVAQTLDVPLLGYIPEDEAVASALHAHKTAAQQPKSEAKKAMDRISARFLGEYVEMPEIRKKKRWFHRHD